MSARALFAALVLSAGCGAGLEPALDAGCQVNPLTSDAGDPEVTCASNVFHASQKCNASCFSDAGAVDWTCEHACSYMLDAGLAECLQWPSN